MNALRTLLAVLMLVFIGVQYNDPDGPLWALIYAVPVVAMALCVRRPDLLRGAVGRTLLTLAVLALAASTLIAWPTMPSFWRQEIWWEEETAREGMGLMIACVVTAVAMPVAWRRKSERRTG